MKIKYEKNCIPRFSSRGKKYFDLVIQMKYWEKPSNTSSESSCLDKKKMHTLINQSPFTRSELTYSHFENFSSTCCCSRNGNWFETKGQFPSLDWCFMVQLSLKCFILKMIDYVHLLKTAAKVMICYHTAERQSCGIKFACQYTFFDNLLYFSHMHLCECCVHTCVFIYVGMQVQARGRCSVFWLIVFPFICWARVPHWISPIQLIKLADYHKGTSVSAF